MRRASTVCAAAAVTNMTMAQAYTTQGGAAGAASSPVFRFGVIADIQYAPINNATNFAGTETRNYRGALDEAAKAVAAWNALSGPGLSFVAQVAFPDPDALAH